MPHKSKSNSQTQDLIPPYKPTNQEHQEFLDKCIKAGVSKTRFFRYMDEMWPEDEQGEQTNA